MADPVIRVEGLTKIFGRRTSEALKRIRQGESKAQVLKATGATAALYDATFTVNEGEVFVVMGLSGSGKSTLVRCLNRLIEPTAGKVFLRDEEVTAADEAALRRLRKERIAMVFQRFALFPHLSVLENAAFGLRVKGVKEEERLAQAEQVLGKMGLAEWAHSRVGQLSGGMQQRVGLARALATDPDVLLLDEPFSALDPLIRREMQSELINLQSELAKTMIFITHDLDEALKLGDRIAVMKDGVIHQIGTPEQILRSPATAYVSEFIEGVNPWGFVTAEDIMLKPDALAKKGDGPRVALRRMRENGLSSLFVVGERGRYAGIVTLDDVVAAIKRDQSDLEGITLPDIPSVTPEMTLEELVPMGATAKYPLPVIDGDGRLQGIVVRAAILGGFTNEAANGESHE